MSCFCVEQSVGHRPGGVGHWSWVFPEGRKFESRLKLNGWERAIQAYVEMPSARHVDNAGPRQVCFVSVRNELVVG